MTDDALVLDSSAVVAVLLDESGADALIARMERASRVAIAAPTVVEAGIVLRARAGPVGGELLDDLLRTLDAIVVPFDPDHAAAALAAWTRYGRGRHPAALNLGDCIAYATAQLAGLPLLARGDDFRRTDLALA
ncbi:MAG: type II toxin-antitoxin system VapC family toxin [Chloroflexota bacterium]